jgi:hypothetical protein
MDEDEKAIESFFDTLLEDKTEKKILKMLAQGMEVDRILEEILSEGRE